MKTNKKVQKNSVQKSEKENAVKVTALAIIPKPIMLLTPQDVPTATEVTASLGTAAVPNVTEETPQQVTFKTPLATATAETDLDITTVQPSTDNHRKTFNDASLQELAESIREVGVLQAIAVRPHTGGGYEIIYGERRYRASLLAGAKTIKATIYNNITDDEAEDMSLSENFSSTLSNVASSLKPLEADITPPTLFLFTAASLVPFALSCIAIAARIEALTPYFFCNSKSFAPFPFNTPFRCLSKSAAVPLNSVEIS